MTESHAILVSLRDDGRFRGERLPCRSCGHDVVLCLSSSERLAREPDAQALCYDCFLVFEPTLSKYRGFIVQPATSDPAARVRDVLSGLGLTQGKD